MGNGKSRERNFRSDPVELNSDDIEALINLTHFSRKEILDWHASFYVSFYCLI